LLHDLLEEVQTESAAVAELLKSLAEANPLADAVSQPTPDDLFVPASFQVVVQCDDEDQQRDVYERLKAEGYQCRVLSL
jgi:hypothetical protein